MKKIRTLIVDDEPLAREGLAVLLAADSSIEVVGSFADGHSAVAAIRAQSPDLVFLDVQMPKLDGFQVLAELKPKERPLVIFVTAYDEYAVRAFEFSAVDYLLKPFRDARFAAALVRAKHEIRQARTNDLDQRVEQLLGYVRDLTRDHPAPPAAPAAAPAPEYADRIVLKTGSDLHFIKTQDVIWIEAQGDFVKVQTTGQAQLVRETLQSMTDKLDAAKFFRIHRSFLVNLEHVRKVTPALYGDYTVLMSDGSKLRLSRNYRGKLKALIAQLPAA
jgi:two-component system LytT family response regulator